jgi:Ca-activated chloride channel family protein
VDAKGPLFLLGAGIVAALWTSAAGASGQEPSRPARAPSVFRSAVDLVTLHVTVTDRRKRYVTDLNQEHFEVFEDGRRQRLKFFQARGLPLALTLLLDASPSMQSAQRQVQEVAHRFVEHLQPQEIASVLGFDASVTVLQDFTADRDALAAAIGRVRGGNGTSLFTALYVALREFDKARRWDGLPRRRTLILLSDGEDSSSPIGLTELLELASSADAAIYAIRLGRPKRAIDPSLDVTERVLRRLADQTGGRAFFPATRYQFPRIHDAIREELASQYSLAYESDGGREDGGFRQLAVLIGGLNAVARTKRGYVARRR